jgi:NAD(P)-dependent dehydrogenase (short-subunit alcohol dehydrogenase family)
MSGMLDGKRGIVTGAGSGIGRETARVFAREGARFGLIDIGDDGGDRARR